MTLPTTPTMTTTAPLATPPPPRIYLSGPMTGLPELNFPAFHAAAALLRAEGREVVNPAEITLDATADWHACMRADVAALATCDAIALLPGWHTSRGAQLELHIAHRLGLAVELVETDAQRLATELADEVAQSDIECNCVAAECAGADWYDTGAEIPDDPAVRQGIEKALRYLDLRGLVTRHPEDSHLVRFAA